MPSQLPQATLANIDPGLHFPTMFQEAVHRWSSLLSTEATSTFHSSLSFLPELEPCPQPAHGGPPPLPGEVRRQGERRVATLVLLLVLLLVLVLLVLAII